MRPLVVNWADAGNSPLVLSPGLCTPWLSTTAFIILVKLSTLWVRMSIWCWCFSISSLKAWLAAARSVKGTVGVAVVEDRTEVTPPELGLRGLSPMEMDVSREAMATDDDKLTESGTQFAGQGGLTPSDSVSRGQPKRVNSMGHLAEKTR